MIRKSWLALALGTVAAWACSSSSSSRLRDADAAVGSGGTGATGGTHAGGTGVGASVDGGGGSAASGGSGASGGASGAFGASGASGGVSDASGGSLGAGGADAQTSRCDRARPFEAPRPLAGVNSAADESLGWMSGDGLTFYFGSQRSGGQGGMDIYRASRNLVSAAFSTVVALPAPVNGSGEEGDPKLSSNGMTLYFSRDMDIYVATRGSAVAEFANVAPVANVNSPVADWVGSLSESGDRLYIQTHRDGPAKIYVAVLEANGSFRMPTPVSELNSPADQDLTPIVTPDTLTIYFGSTRSAAGTKGGSDIFVARRTTASNGFGPPEVVPELNGTMFESPSWVSADDCEIILTRRSAAVPIQRDFLIAARPK